MLVLLYVRFEMVYSNQNHNKKKFMDLCYFFRQALAHIDEIDESLEASKYLDLFRPLRTKQSLEHNETIWY
jgi:hypothetical protein